MASAASLSTADDSYLSLSSDLGKTKLLCDETKEQHSFPKDKEKENNYQAKMKISQPRSQAWIKDGISSKRSAIDTKCYNDSLMEVFR
jgi:hypothetical protein